MTTWMTGLARPDARIDGYGFAGLVEGTEEQARAAVRERFNLDGGEHEEFILVNPMDRCTIIILQADADDAEDFAQVAICQVARCGAAGNDIIDAMDDDAEVQRVRAMTQAEAWEECARVIWEEWAEAEEAPA